MQLQRIQITDFMGIDGTISLDVNSLSVFVGRNDAGKSTLLKALHVFFNESAPDIGQVNRRSQTEKIEITCSFMSILEEIDIDEGNKTTLLEEDLIGDDGLFHLKKTWDFSGGRSKAPEVHVLGHTLGGIDLLLLNQRDLISQCEKFSIETRSAGGKDFNNAEKRRKLRAKLTADSVERQEIWHKLATTGQGRGKAVYDGIKKALPKFEYFKADTSLDESDTATQNHFRSEVKFIVDAMSDATTEIESTVQERLGLMLNNLTEKINGKLPDDSQVQFDISFDWSKLVKVTFSTATDDGDIPFTSRGDGFRRVTMMSLFEHLAEQDNHDRENIIYGFEEPETFLHPTAQEKLFESLLSLSRSHFQVFICTHSPVLVASSPKQSLIHICRTDGKYTISRDVQSYERIAEDLGISEKNQFLSTFDKAKVLFLVEGSDDIKAFEHVCSVYKEKGLVESSFEELGVVFFPVGGKDSIKHWFAVKTLSTLSKPFLIFLDSDKETESDLSPNRKILIDLGLQETTHFILSRKRMMENYMTGGAIKRIVPDSNLTFTDFCHLKNICGAYADPTVRQALGGKRILDHHFEKMTFDELREAFRHPEHEDEFLHVYKLLKDRLPQRV